MANLIRLKILTPRGNKFDQQVRMVEVKTPEGYIGLMYNHVPFVATLSANVIYITYANNTRESGVLDSATLYCTRDEIKIFSFNFVLSKDINLQKVAREKQELEERLSRINDLTETAKLERMLEYELLKLKQGKQ